MNRIVFIFFLTVVAGNGAFGGDALKAEEKPADWHLANWPAEDFYGKNLENKNAKHSWKNSKGEIVAEILLKDGQPFEGLTYRQGASDYRFITRWKEGIGTVLYSYLLKDGRWTIFGKQGGNGQPPSPSESKSQGGDK